MGAARPDLPSGWEQDEGFCSSWAPRWASSWLGQRVPGRQARPSPAERKTSPATNTFLHRSPRLTSEVAQQVFLEPGSPVNWAPVHMGLSVDVCEPSLWPCLGIRVGRTAHGELLASVPV